MIDVKILSLGDPERYALRRLVVAAERELLMEYPTLHIKISEVNQASEIGKVARVLVLPTLVINGKVVCTGRYPELSEVLDWLKNAVEKT